MVYLDYTDVALTCNYCYGPSSRHVKGKERKHKLAWVTCVSVEEKIIL